MAISLFPLKPGGKRGLAPVSLQTAVRCEKPARSPCEISALITQSLRAQHNHEPERQRIRVLGQRRTR